MSAAQTYNHLQNHHANAAAAASHFAQINTFQQHSAILHHPQPMPFGTLLHPTPILPNSAMTAQHASSFASTTSIVSKFSEQPKMTQNHFSDFPSINSNFYKPFNNQMQQLSPSNSKSTISIDSSSASSVSERIMSPHSHSTIDSHSGNIVSSPPPIPQSPSTTISNVCVNQNNNNQTTIDPKVSSSTTTTTQLSVSSSTSTSPLASITSRNISSTAVSAAAAAATLASQQQTARTNMQNGLLDILMCPDKYQELIQYHQVQNSIIFPSLHAAAYPIDALNSPRLPTWEFLQVSSLSFCCDVAMQFKGNLERDRSLTHHHLLS